MSFFRLKSYFFNHEPSDNVNVNVIKHGDALLATTDSPFIQVASTTDLNLTQKVTYKTVHFSPGSWNQHFLYDNLHEEAGVNQETWSKQNK